MPRSSIRMKTIFGGRSEGGADAVAGPCCQAIGLFGAIVSVLDAVADGVDVSTCGSSRSEREQPASIERIMAPAAKFSLPRLSARVLIACIIACSSTVSCRSSPRL